MLSVGESWAQVYMLEILKEFLTETPIARIATTEQETQQDNINDLFQQSK